MQSGSGRKPLCEKNAESAKQKHDLAFKLQANLTASQWESQSQGWTPFFCGFVVFFHVMLVICQDVKMLMFHEGCIVAF